MNTPDRIVREGERHKITGLSRHGYLTLEQKANAFDSLTSDSGTYSIDGDTVTRHVYIRKNPIPITDFPNNGRPVRFSVENDTLTTYNPNNPNNFTVHKRANLK